jgi:hypothetical protein
MKFSRKQSKKSKAAGIFKTYLEFAAARRLLKVSPLLAAAATVATVIKRRRASGEPSAV